jgi:hypothetical protein
LLVARADETPAAINIWLMFAPPRLRLCIQALGNVLTRLAPQGCPLFVRPASRHALRLFPAMGFAERRIAAAYARFFLEAEIPPWT